MIHSSDGLHISPYVQKPEESYMSEEQLAHFRKILLDWKEQLIQGSEMTKSHLQEDVINFPDPTDRASQEEGFSMELRARDRELK